MSVLIKGMEMPEGGCRGCLFVNRKWKGDVCQILKREVTGNVERGGFQPDCPLTEVPPHGRLIDADKITKQLDGIWDCNDMVFEDDNICGYLKSDYNSCRWRETRDYIRDHVIKHAPTIIEAEEGET